MKSKVNNTQTNAYLDQRLTAPGDVLLQLGEGWESAAIALATKSPFSHAAILVAGMMMYEALDDGVLPTPLSLVDVRPVGGDIRRALAMSGVRAARLLRHRKLEKDVMARRYDVGDDFMEVLLKFIGRHYADICDLLRAAPSDSPLRKLGSWLKANLIHDRLPKSKRGIFCSELVARTYAAVGLPLFEKVTPAGRVNPGDLDRSPFLCEVKGGVFSAQLVPLTSETTNFIMVSDMGPKREDHATYDLRAKKINESLKRQEANLRSIRARSSRRKN